MIVDNGERKRLEIPGVFSGMAGVAGPFVSFIPNRRGKEPEDASGATLEGVPVVLKPVKEASGPFWTSRYEVVE